MVDLADGPPVSCVDDNDVHELAAALATSVEQPSSSIAEWTDRSEVIVSAKILDVGRTEIGDQHWIVLDLESAEVLSDDTIDATRIVQIGIAVESPPSGTDPLLIAPVDPANLIVGLQMDMTAPGGWAMATDGPFLSCPRRAEVAVGSGRPGWLADDITFGVLRWDVIAEATGEGAPQRKALAAATDRWSANGLADYDLAVSEWSAWESGSYEAVVRNGELLAWSAEGNHELFRGVDVRTVEDMLDLLARFGSAHRTVDYDPDMGHPLSMKSDDPEAIDEERGWTIERLEPAQTDGAIPAGAADCALLSAIDAADRQMISLGSRQVAEVAEAIEGRDVDSYCLDLPPLGLLTKPYGAQWALAPDTDPEATTITILVEDPLPDCPPDPRGRATVAEQEEGDDWVYVSVILEPVPWSDRTCTPWEPMPLTIELDAPLGDRVLEGGDERLPPEAA